jgi:acid phosphatase type 7
MNRLLHRLTSIVSLARLCLLIVVAIATPARARQSGPQSTAIDPDLRLHLGVTAGKVKGGGFVDKSGRVRGSIVGNPMKAALGPAEGFRFNGADDWLVMGDGTPAGREWLPQREMTVEAWVSLHATAKSGAVIAFAEDNGGSEQGWILGYNAEFFSFAVAGKGSDDGDGKLTYLQGTTRIEKDRWYHVAGVYDGRVMRLFVNGKEEAMSTEQSGDILYPAKNTGSIAGYLDSDEKTPMNGVLLETKVLARALNAQQINEEYAPGVRLTSFEPTLESVQRFVARPYLQFITRDSATIMCETSRPCIATIEYGTQLPYTMKFESGEPSRMHEMVLQGLSPQTPYFYRVRCRNEDGTELVGDDLTFQTVVDAQTPFAFAVIGDTQKNKPVIERLQAFAFSQRPNFEIHLGDVVDKGADRAEWTQELLEASWPLMSRICMYPAIGNHEENHSNYYTYFSLPGPEYRYTYTYGNAQFFVIDTNKPVDPESEQYRWLDRELAASTAVWKFVYHHHPVYSSDEDDYGDTYKGPSTYGDMRLRPLAALYEKHGVDISFNGHIHAYERTWPIREGRVDMSRGVRYISSGGGGGGLESTGPNRSWFSQRVYRGHHMCTVMISGKTLVLQAFDLEGRLFDTMEINKP